MLIPLKYQYAPNEFSFYKIPQVIPLGTSLMKPPSYTALDENDLLQEVTAEYGDEWQPSQLLLNSHPPTHDYNHNYQLEWHYIMTSKMTYTLKGDVLNTKTQT